MGKAAGSAKGGTTVASSAPTTSAGSASVASSAQQPVASDGAPEIRETLVLDWDPQALGQEVQFENERGIASDGSSERPKRQMGGADIDDAPAEIEAHGAGEGRQGQGDDEAEESPADAATRAQRRAAVLAALSREKGQRASEEQARAARAEATEAKARVKELTDRLEGLGRATPEAKLKMLGMTKDELTDFVLMGGGTAEDAAKLASKKPEASAEVAELRARLDAADKKAADDEKTRKDAEAQKNIAEARVRITELIKDVEAPLVKGLGEQDRVLRGAWDAWMYAGKKGSVEDYVPAAAEFIEEQLKTERPLLSERIYGNGDDDAAPVPRRTQVAKREPVPSVGRRTRPARPAQQTNALPLDPDARTRAIIKENGWS